MLTVLKTTVTVCKYQKILENTLEERLNLGNYEIGAACWCDSLILHKCYFPISAKSHKAVTVEQILSNMFVIISVVRSIVVKSGKKKTGSGFYIITYRFYIGLSKELCLFIQAENTCYYLESGAPPAAAMFYSRIWETGGAGI